MNATRNPTFLTASFFEPNAYIDCNYTFYFKYSNQYRPSVEIYDIEVNGGKSCVNGSIAVYDGENIGAPLIDRFCGKRNYLGYMASRGSLMVRFKANAWISKGTFYAKFFHQPTGRYTRCNNLI